VALFENYSCCLDFHPLLRLACMGMSAESWRSQSCCASAAYSTTVLSSSTAGAGAAAAGAGSTATAVMMTTVVDHRQRQRSGQHHPVSATTGIFVAHFSSQTTAYCC